MRHHPFDAERGPDPRHHLHEHLRQRLHDHLDEGLPGFGPGPVGFRRPPLPPVPPGPGFGFGFGGPRGRGHGHGHGGRGRTRRGNVRAAVLLLLADRPMHGYEIIQEISERSRGWWRPSPGSVYPTLQLLADEGLVTGDQDNASGKRLYALTDEGRAEGERQDTRTPPWEQMADDVDPNEAALREVLMTLMGATNQLAAAGTAEMRAKAVKILVDARRQLYLMLADAGVEQDEQVTDES
jgi:DNA-binding PadR family transcriptional regulator